MSTDYFSDDYVKAVFKIFFSNADQGEHEDAAASDHDNTDSDILFRCFNIMTEDHSTDYYCHCSSVSDACKSVEHHAEEYDSFIVSKDDDSISDSVLICYQDPAGFWCAAAVMDLSSGNTCYLCY